jgi:hypothetical protein
VLSVPQARMSTWLTADYSSGLEQRCSTSCMPGHTQPITPAAHTATQNPLGGECAPHVKMWAGVSIALYGHTDARAVSRRTRPRLGEREWQSFAVTLVVAVLRSDAEYGGRGSVQRG